MNFLKRILGMSDKPKSRSVETAASFPIDFPTTQEVTKEELLKRIDENPNVCDRGYDFAEFDRQGYCHWVLDCSQHVFPLAAHYLPEDEMSRLGESIQTGRLYLEGKVDADAVEAAATVPQGILDKFSADNGNIPHELFETLTAAENAIKLTLPDAKVYHEDVVYATARAALAGLLHDSDSTDMPEPSDCCPPEELTGSEESHIEQQWQLLALKDRLCSDKR